MRKIGSTDLEVFPLCLGGNVFGWTANEAQSFRILDAYFESGGNFIDTADVYADWVDGNSGGESETLIGRWLAARAARDRIVIATKVGQAEGLEGLAAPTIRKAAEASLRRLGVDQIDIYYAHIDDEATPLEETLGAFDALVHEGKVRYVAASNITASRLSEALAISGQAGLARYVAISPHYNLVHQNAFEGELADLCQREGLAAFPYAALADGFLTGKYRPGRDAPKSERAEDALEYLDDRGAVVLRALDEVASGHEVSVAAVALAWLASRSSVVAPVVSVRTPDQLADILPAAELRLTDQEIELLRAVGVAFN
jgi:aryl-alcohol dehydrogenase (NADP+)